MPRWRRLAGLALGTWSLMAGPLEELTDGDSQRLGDGCDRRGPRVDALAFGAGDRLSEQSAPVGDVRQAQAPRLPNALDALHAPSVNDNVTIVKADGTQGLGESP